MMFRITNLEMFDQYKADIDRFYDNVLEEKRLIGR